MKEVEVIISLLPAVGLGILHALEPGHGKSAMAAYLIAVRGRILDAVLMGLIAASMHTLVIGAIAATGHLLLAAATAATSSPADVIFSRLKIASGLVILAVGLRTLRNLRQNRSDNHRCHHYPTGDPSSFLLLGITAGLNPCPSALAVLLMALAEGNLRQGIYLVLAFGLGGALALTLTAIIFVLLAQQWRQRHGTSHLERSIGLICALFLLVIGAAMIWQGVWLL